MLPDVADKAADGCARAAAGGETGLAVFLPLARDAQCVPDAYKVTRGLGLNMANNPKKVKDPTEVALSAIQEALNISDSPGPDTARNSMRDDAMQTNESATSAYNEPVFNEPSFDTR